MAKKKQNLVEICRSFSYKLNLGNFTNADFFASAKSTSLEKEAEKTSQSLYTFCKEQVVKDVNNYLKNNGKRPEISAMKAELLDELKKWLKNPPKPDYGKQPSQEAYD